MSTSPRTRSTPHALAGAAALAAFAGLAPSTASAADYDIDCKLLLCLPGGFPSGCSDAFDHMIDRLKDGKSPIGFCGMSSGDEYDAYEIDYETQPAISPRGWECPAGKTLYHEVRSADDDNSFFARRVNTFCYDTAHERRGWTAEGMGIVTTYINKTPPLRRDFRVKLTLESGTPSEFSQGWQAFDTGRSSSFRVSFTE